MAEANHNQAPVEDEGGNEYVQFRFRDDEPASDPAVTVEAFLDQPNATAVLIEAGEDVEHLIPQLDRVRLVEIDFPRFRDGRGFSSAQILREAGYQGEIRATGEVLVDLVYFMRRCGFDSFAPAKPLNPDDVAAALNRYSHVYQDATDDAVPIWALRHPELRRSEERLDSSAG